MCTQAAFLLLKPNLPSSTVIKINSYLERHKGPVPIGCAYYRVWLEVGAEANRETQKGPRPKTMEVLLYFREAGSNWDIFG